MRGVFLVKGANIQISKLRVPPLISNFKTAPSDNAIDLPYTDSIPKKKRCQQLILLFFEETSSLKIDQKCQELHPLHQIISLFILMKSLKK